VRIGVDAGRLVYGRGGVASYTRELIRGLASEGVEDEVVLFNLDRSRSLAVAVADAFGDLPPRVRIAGRSSGELERIDVFHAPGFAVPTVGGARVVFTLHDLTVLSHPGCHTLANRVRTLTSVADALARDATTIAVSEATRREALRLLALPTDRIEVVPPIVNPTFQAGGDGRIDAEVTRRFGLGEAFVLWVGSLEPRKNVGRLLDAWTALADHLRRSHQLVLVAADGWSQRSLSRRLDRLARSGTVVRISRLDHAELAALCRRTRLLVFPSLAEGFGLPVAEAMACGAPVVTSNVSSLPEVAGDAAVLVDPEDVDAITAGMARVLEDEDLRRDLRERGRERSRRFTASAVIPRLLEVYRRVAERSNV